jgi:3-oxoacyl-[acyl-carrier protein] reductase
MRTVLVSGASSDIGLAVCRRYLSEGWKVVAHFRTERPELKALSCERLEFWQADFSDTDALEAKLATDPAFFSRPDAFVNLAAAMPACDFVSATAAAILDVMRANVVPGILISQAVAPHMLQRGWGRIVHASSIGVKFGGGSDSYLYSLSKHAGEFIPSAARGWAAGNVLVNVVRVGVTDTRGHRNFPAKSLAERVERIPAKRMAAPHEVAEFIFWLGSDANTVMSGQVVHAAGGE